MFSNKSNRLIVPVTFLREVLNLTDRRIAQLAREGVIVRLARGRYDAMESIKGYIRFLQEVKAKTSCRADPEYDDQRTRYYKAKADMAEIKAAAFKKQFHHAGCIAEVMNVGIAAIRSRLLALPGLAAPQVAAISDAKQCAAILTTLVHDALTECSKYDGREVVARYLKQYSLKTTGGEKNCVNSSP